MDIDIEFRAHDIKDFKDYFDYLPAASPAGNRLTLDILGRPTQSEDDIDGTPNSPWTGYQPVWNAWTRIKRSDIAVVHLVREGPERVKTDCFVDPNCTGEDRSYAYLDNSATNDGTGEDAVAFGNHQLFYDKLRNNQDLGCSAENTLFGRMTRRILFFSDSGSVGSDLLVAPYSDHFSLSNSLYMTPTLLPGSAGGSGCLTPLWTVDSENSGAASRITINQDCSPPPALWLLYKKLASDVSFSIIGPIRSNVVFRDQSVKRGQTYKYVLRPVSSGGLPGSFTAEKAVTIVDTSPPVAPHVVLASGANSSVSFSWSESKSPDVLKFNVYAAPASGGPYTKITPQPTTAKSIVVSGVPAGQWRYGVVTAIDTSGNESAVSVEVGAEAQ